MYVYGTLLNVRFLVKLGIVGNSSFGQSLLAVLLFKMGTEPWCGCVVVLVLYLLVILLALSALQSLSLVEVGTCFFV